MEGCGACGVLGVGLDVALEEGVDIAFEAEGCGDEGGADPHSIAHLAPVDGAGIIVDLGGDFGASRQWMHEDAGGGEEHHLVGADGEAGGIDASAFAFGLVPFVLDASHVDGIGVGEFSVEVFAEAEGDVVGAEHVEDVVANLEGCGCDENLCNAGVVEQEIGEGSDGAAAFEVADEDDGPIAEAAFAFEAALEGIDIEQGLGGVLIGSGAGIDDGDWA